MTGSPAATLLLASLLAVPAPGGGFHPVDVQARANHRLGDAFHDGNFEHNDLAEVPRGRHRFADVPFAVGDKLVQLGSKRFNAGPAKVEGIPVHRRLDRLHFLHGTGYFVPDDTVIGRYVVHYADGSKAEVEIVYGKDVRDWWSPADVKGVSRGRVAWVGSNGAVKPKELHLRLYRMTWDNPHPRRRVTTIDVSSSMTDAAPFVVAITAETR